MTYELFHSTALTILAAIITGGFVLVFVEIGNRKNRDNDYHYQILAPFMNKLSAYFRYIMWCQSSIIYPKELNGNEVEFKKLIHVLSRYGTPIINGNNYAVDRFTAEELDHIAFKINNIWYFHDRMHPCRLKWNNESIISEKVMNKFLSEINPIYTIDDKDIDLIAKVSGDFYVDCYQRIENEIYRHEAYMKMYRYHTVLVSSYVLIVLLLLSLLLFFILPSKILQWWTILIILMFASCFLMLGIDVRKQINWKYKVKEFSQKTKQKMKKVFRRFHFKIQH